MFAKRQSALAAAAGAPPVKVPLRDRFAPVTRALKKPPVAVGAAGLMLFAAGALFIAVLGDPRAGQPSARVSLNRQAAAEAPAPTGFEAFSAGAMGLYQDLTGAEAQGGDALITLPDGATVSGSGAPITAPQLAPSSPLPQAPIAGLFRPGPNGPLPVIAADGRVPAQAYARPFHSNGNPRIAITVGGLGLNAVTTRAAIERLPAEVTLAFVPYAEGLQGWIDLARAHGHEVMIEMPMEPTGYPQTDPGPYTLLANGGEDDINAKMAWLLGRATGYFAVTNYLGDRFIANDEAMGTFMGILRQRGVAFIDDGSASRRPGAWARASANRIIDETQNPAAILGQLNALEALAKTRGSAMGAGFSYPVTVEAVARWTAGLNERGIQLAPASAMASRPGR
ncbi:MAG TPA: divergent polysaccharide deacetylase family protein [Brevundimonas sp.]